MKALRISSSESSKRKMNASKKSWLWAVEVEAQAATQKL